MGKVVSKRVKGLLFNPWSLWGVLMALGAALLNSDALPVFSDINDYADQCACQLGAGEGQYMPSGILPDDPDSKAIPVFWNQKRISYTETDPATGAPQPGSGHWEYLFANQPGVKHVSGVTMGFPDAKNTVGRITDKADLKCDYWSHVNTNKGGCVPGQRTLQKQVGDVTWIYLFRREQPPKPGQVAWDPFHPYYFNIMDVNAYNSKTGGTCWFDTVIKGQGGAGMTEDSWWKGRSCRGGLDSGKACSIDADCRGAGTCQTIPQGIPRPGGKDIDKQARAAFFWDTTKDMQEGNCSLCHGNGPVLSSRWINQGDGVPFKLPNGKRDDEQRYWNAAGLFANPEMFSTAAGGGTCGGCHRLWSRTPRCAGGTKAGEVCAVDADCLGGGSCIAQTTCPGGSLAEAMTSLGQCMGGVNMDKPCGTDSQCPGSTCQFSRDVMLLASAYRLQVDSNGRPLMQCMGGGNAGNACANNADCPGGTCENIQDAGVMFEMPHTFSGTPQNWDTRIRPRYDKMKECCTMGGAKCTTPMQATVPNFFGPQMNPAPPNPKQLMAAPDPALAFTVQRFNCVVAADGSETCEYKATWNDPVNDYQAPDTFYIETTAANNKPGTPAPATAPYCPAVSMAMEEAPTDIVGSNWRQSHTLTKQALAACTKIAVRLCGGHCGTPPDDSRNVGLTATVETACAKPIASTRSGYRLHRATGRYVQTVTVQNTGTDPITEPVTLLLYNLSSNATLFNQSGTTTCVIPTGTPYIHIPVGGNNILSPGESAAVLLEFTNPSDQGITYDARVRAGNGCL